MGQSDAGFSNVNINLRGIEHSFESIIDDMLSNIAAAQMMLTNATGMAPADVTARYTAIVLGEKGYIFAITAINFALLALYLFEAFRTMGWRKLSTFDYNNLAKIVVATSVGGQAVGDYALKTPTRAQCAHVIVDSSDRRGAVLRAADVDSNFSNPNIALQLLNSNALVSRIKVASSPPLYAPLASPAFEAEEPFQKPLKRKPVPRMVQYELLEPS